jgi:mannan endo-1,4-beta-mannosidase
MSARVRFLLTALVLVLVGCDVSAPPCAPGALVSADGTRLCLDGAPFRFLGANRYDLLSSARYTCGRSYDDAELERVCAEAATTGLSVLRTWAFSTFTDGGRDFAPLDRLIAAAGRHDLRLVLTLENEWADCTTPDATDDGRKGTAWFAGGWRDTLGPYLDAVVDRYRDEPRVAAWQLINEGECLDPSALRAFADEASRRIKAIDARHLVSLGTIGTGQAGTTGEDYRRLHELPAIDLVEAHDYHHPEQRWPDAIADDAAIAASLGKPFFIGEAGIAAPDPGVSLEDRARLFDDKIRAALAAGVAGYVLWSFYDLRTPTMGWDFAPDDPLAAVLRGIAKTL